MRAQPYYCWDCKVMFTIYYTLPRRGNKRVFCTKCGENVATKRNPYTTGKHPDQVGTKPRWTDAEKKRLIELYNTTALMSREIAAELGKTDKAVRNMISRLGLAMSR